MGLTIHYDLRSDAASPDEARRRVESLRQRALDLPFERVGDLREFRGEACRHEGRDVDGTGWLLIQARRTVYHGEIPHDAHPDHVIAFTVHPGAGCEPANFGLCRYPAEVDRWGGGRLPTGLDGWRWSSFCKTQYASNPDCGGVENFLRCHLSLVGLLDHAAKLGLGVEVEDESGFYDDRDAEGLAAEVVRWNKGMAAFTGQLKDILGDGFAAEITRFPNFERLEAEGRRDETP